MSPLLEVQDLVIRFKTRHGQETAVDGVSLALAPGETLAVVGESGSGKSVTARALTRLLPPAPLCRIEGRIRYGNKDVLTMNDAELRALRGREIAYIFQEPSASLNPVFTVGEQIGEAIRLHFPQEQDITGRVIQALEQVGIRDPERRYRDYPHQLSGGMNQRVMIAMALACRPRVLIADEPTTALDVTIQAEIMKLLRSIRDEREMAIVLITHNFGIVKGFAKRVAVMYQGKIVEQGPTAEILDDPQHPYTRALIACIPRLGARRRRLPTIDREALEKAP
ncbi:MAG: ABC transporter ATP-binding protein [Candidatus Competibacteraceae bacterium]|nr:ABC transporter ATP-binding protein [Candidatus Competibacteraceae bacterium]